MKFTYNDSCGPDIDIDNLASLSEILKKPFSHWARGGGDSSIELPGNNCLIFFKTEQGIFIQHLQTYTAPLIRTNYQAIQSVTHYVGGDPMEVPDICLCNEETALNIFEHFINTGELTPDYKWVDIYDYIEYKE